MNEKYDLRTLFWETTLRCNARCAFCGSGCGENMSCEGELTTQEIKNALADTAEKLPAKNIMLNITGGEPLVRQDVFEVAGHASSLGFPWGMVTNGSLITPEVIGKMERAGMSTLTVSIDGCRETHERLRKLSGSFDRIISSLREIKKAGFLHHIQVTTVVNKQNIGELEELRKVLLDIGPDSWRVVTADPIGRAKDNSSILLGSEEMHRYFEFVGKYAGDLDLPVVQSCSHYFGEWEPRLRTRSFECGAGRHVASILYNGDIYVCPNVERRPELIQGNVRTDSLGDLWKSGFEWFRRKDRTLSENCRSCYYREDCLGDSLHTWLFDENRPAFCIREFYSVPQNASYSAKSELYNKTVSGMKKECPSPSALRVFSDRPSAARAVFTRTASKMLYDFFEWGRNTVRNKDELMAVLLGRREDNMFVVSSVKEIALDFSDETSAVFSHGSLESALEVLSDAKKTVPDTEILGFVHSHPNELETVLSVSDVELHRYLQNKLGLSLSVLVNPQKRRLKAYFGRELDTAEVRLLGAETENSLWCIQN